jgi:dGTPase
MPAVVAPGDMPLSPAPRICHGDTVTVHSDELLAFLRERFYRSKRVLDAMRIGRDKIAARFHYFVAHQDAIPAEMRRRSGDCSPQRRACDYVAGMTDRFLMQQ